jgi:sortase (surface protein transpeptidase)
MLKKIAMSGAGAAALMTGIAGAQTTITTTPGVPNIGAGDIVLNAVILGISALVVIAGHVDNGLGLAGVFKNLGSLREGDAVFVERRDGTQVAFIVAGTRSYHYQDAPTEIIFNPSGSVRLNLITCEGRWIQADRTYDERLVVFTRLAEGDE